MEKGRLAQIWQAANNSGSFAIFLKPNASETESLLAEALRKTLSLKNLRVYFISDIPQDALNKWQELFKDFKKNTLPQIISIKIPSAENSAEEVSYFKSNDSLTLEINSAEKLKKENIAITQKPAKMDIVFCFGQRENLLNQVTEIGALPEKEKIIYLAPAEETLSEQVLAVIKKISPNENKKIADLLLAALVTETESFSRRISPGTLETGKYLLEEGANKTIIFEATEKEKQNPLTQIIGRAMTRTRVKEKDGISWTFLSEEDFSKSNIGPPSVETILKIMHKIRSFVSARPLMVMVWQDEDGIQVLVKNFDDSGNSAEKMLCLSENAACPLQDGFFVMGPFKTFTEAEIQTQKMLKESGF